MWQLLRLPRSLTAADVAAVVAAKPTAADVAAAVAVKPNGG
jgi:hypothetical protein